MSSKLEAPPLMRKLLIGQLFQNPSKLPVYNAIRQVWELDISDADDDDVCQTPKELSWCMLWLQGRIIKCHHPNSCNFLLDDSTGEILVVYELNKSQSVNYEPSVGDYVAVIGKLVQPSNNNNEKNEALNCWHVLAKSVTQLGGSQNIQDDCLSPKSISNSGIYELSWPLEVLDMTYSL
ncbi:unnamed protein product [Trichobilharzia szidati]|nr:unnamed protein product [Trichobilharzia szidati]